MMTNHPVLLSLAFVCGASASAALYDLGTAVDIRGQNVSLSGFKGSVSLVVNVATN